MIAAEFPSNRCGERDTPCQRWRPVALVTGSATGVGRACILQFASRGYDVVVNYSRSEQDAKQTAADAEALGAKTLVIRCDVANNVGVRQMINEINDTFGRLDALVNNAATTTFIEHGNLDALTEEMWDPDSRGQPEGGVLCRPPPPPTCSRASGAGSVVNVSSVAAMTGSGSSIAYCADQGGIEHQ